MKTRNQTIRLTKRTFRKLHTIYGKRLIPNVGVRARYRADLMKLIDAMVTETREELLKLFRSNEAVEYFALDASIGSQARILTDALFKKFTLVFGQEAKTIAERMVKNSDKTAKSSLAASLNEFNERLTIQFKRMPEPLKEILKAGVAENVSLIKSIPQQYLTQVQGAVMRSIESKGGIGSLIKSLGKYQGITKRRATNIARDQTRKVYNFINKERMVNSNVPGFEWVHSGGGHEPRPDHIAMNGKTFRFDNLPIIDKRTGERGIPGQAINCGCTMVPMMDLNEE